MKRALRISLWILLFSGFFTLLSFTTASFKEKRCNEIFIHVNNVSGYPLINESYIENFLIDNSYRVRGQLITEIPVDEIESKVNDLSHVRTSKVYSDLMGDLHIKIEQKQPIARVFNPNGSSFYMDDKGNRMDLSNLYSARVLAITSEKGIDLLEMEEQSELSQKEQLYRLVQKINNEPFWSSQIVQVHLNDLGEIELTPRVGNHKILLGKATDLSSKFEKLWNFYQTMSEHRNWNAYKVLNVKYKDQIVCTKK
ncbi:MAG: hypothetical protein HKN39_03190 [Flavobacteriales bacterium]|nr:hypothetical protein [Flavobacteriales bacterium]